MPWGSRTFVFPGTRPPRERPVSAPVGNATGHTTDPPNQFGGLPMYVHMGFGEFNVRESMPHGLSPEALDDYATRIRRQLVALINEVDPDVAVPETEASNAADPEAT